MNNKINENDEKYLKYFDKMVWAVVIFNCLIFIMTIFTELK